jgi:hypothetical protein
MERFGVPFLSESILHAALPAFSIVRKTFSFAGCGGVVQERSGGG